MKILDKRYFWIHPTFLYLFIFFVVPVFFVLVISVHHYHPTDLYVRPLTLVNYEEFLFDPWYVQWITYTLRLGLIVTLTCALLGYPLGYQMAHSSKRMQQLLLFLILTPLMVGAVVRTYGWMVIGGRRGLVNERILFFRDEPISIMGETYFVIIGVVGIVLPFMVLPIYSSFQNFDESIGKAARNLGANPVQEFYKITLPLTLSGIVTGGILCFVITMSIIVTPDLLGGRTDVTLGILIFENALDRFNWPRAATIAVVIAGVNFFLVFIYILIFRRYTTLEQ